VVLHLHHLESLVNRNGRVGDGHVHNVAFISGGMNSLPIRLAKNNAPPNKAAAIKMVMMRWASASLRIGR